VRGDAPGPPLLAYVSLSSGVDIDTSWFKGAGLRASESHRVVFDGTPVLAVLGEPGELLREPYFSRDAVLTAVTWAGMSDTAVDATLDVLAAKSGSKEPDDVVSLAAGKMLTAQGTIDRWLAHAAAFADTDPSSLPGIAIQLRRAVASCCREILDPSPSPVRSTGPGATWSSSSSSTAWNRPWYAAGGGPSRRGALERAARTRVFRGALRRVGRSLELRDERVRAYQVCQDAGRAWRTQVSKGPGGRSFHRRLYGDPLTLTAETYAQVGGLEPRATLEDERLEQVLREQRIPIERLLSVRATTSSRLKGRASRGLAHDLAAAAARLDRTDDRTRQ
jgi:hypothetical protein